MTFPRIVTAEERLARRRGVKVALWAESGMGKTWQARYLDPLYTVFVDMEAGTLSLTAGDAWRGTIIEDVKTLQAAQGIVVLAAGADPSKPNDQPYSQAHYDAAAKAMPELAELMGRVHTIFFDSITALSRMAWEVAKVSPAAINKKGDFDPWGAYREVATSMVGLISHLQGAREKDVVMVGILDKKINEFKQQTYEMQLIGNQTGEALHGVFDNIVTLAEVWDNNGSADLVSPTTPLSAARQRAFICQKPNPWAVPAKDRSGQLAMLEPPNLGQLIAKMAGRAPA